MTFLAILPAFCFNGVYDYFQGLKKPLNVGYTVHTLHQLKQNLKKDQIHSGKMFNIHSPISVTCVTDITDFYFGSVCSIFQPHMLIASL